MTLDEQIEEAGQLVRACAQMRENETDPARLEIIRACTNRATDRLHILLSRIETDELLKRAGIDVLARSLSTDQAMQRALEAIDIPVKDVGQTT